MAAARSRDALRPATAMRPRSIPQPAGSSPAPRPGRRVLARREGCRAGRGRRCTGPGRRLPGPALPAGRAGGRRQLPGGRARGTSRGQGILAPQAGPAQRGLFRHSQSTDSGIAHCPVISRGPGYLVAESLLPPRPAVTATYVRTHFSVRWNEPGGAAGIAGPRFPVFRVRKMISEMRGHLPASRYGSCLPGMRMPSGDTAAGRGLPGTGLRPGRGQVRREQDQHQGDARGELAGQVAGLGDAAAGDPAS